MTTDPSWFETDEFWNAFAPWGFDAKRLQAAVGEVDQAVALLGLPEGAEVLDLCCGIGRHSVELACRDYRVVGVDLHAGYLKEAHQKAMAKGLDIEFVCTDMREFRRPGGFDAVLNLFTSFGYFDAPEDDRLVVENAFDSLRPGGQLLMEMMGKEILARKFQPRDWQERDGALMLEERKIIDDWGKVRSRWVFINGGQRREFEMSIRCYSATEVCGLLRICGFEYVRAFGNLAGEPYDQNAQRLIVKATKPT